jgi:hypothetical protein
MEYLTSLNENGNLIVDAVYRICFEYKGTHFPVLIRITGANEQRGDTAYFLCDKLDAEGNTLKQYTLSKQDIVSRLPVMNEVLAEGEEF